MSRYLLIPIERPNTENKQVILPDGLVVDPWKDLYDRARDQNQMKELLLKLSKLDITEDLEHGFVKHKGEVMMGVNFRNVILDSCNGKYLPCYEKFYELLRKFDIIF